MNNNIVNTTDTKKEYMTVIYALNDYSKRIFDSYNETIKIVNQIDRMCEDNNGYDLINIIVKLGLFTDLGELLVNLEDLQEAYKLAYEQGVYLNQMDELSFNELNSIKQAMDNINKVDITNLKALYKFMSESAEKITSIIPKK